MDNLVFEINKVSNELEMWHKQTDAEWEKLKNEYITKTGDNLKFIDHMKEMSEKVRAQFGNKIEKETFEILSKIADEYLNADFKRRLLFTDVINECQPVFRELLNYIGYAYGELLHNGKEIWVKRAVVIAAISRGHYDYRDLIMSLLKIYIKGLEKSMGVNKIFVEVGRLAEFNKNRGGLNKSIGDFLVNFSTNYIK